jgi:hypothetical protein
MLVLRGPAIPGSRIRSVSKILETFVRFATLIHWTEHLCQAERALGGCFASHSDR